MVTSEPVILFFRADHWLGRVPSFELFFQCPVGFVLTGDVDLDVFWITSLCERGQNVLPQARIVADCIHVAMNYRDCADQLRIEAQRELKADLNKEE